MYGIVVIGVIGLNLFQKRAEVLGLPFNRKEANTHRICSGMKTHLAFIIAVETLGC